MDEVHFQQYGSACRMWIPSEDKDPLLLHHPTRKALGYFGAVQLRDGTFLVRRETEQFDGQTKWSFFRRLRQVSARSVRQVVVIINDAKYHHASLHRDWRQAQEPDFVLAFLPPYSPELNPIERVWKLVRGLCLHNQHFPELALLVATLEQQFAERSNGSPALAQLCSPA